MPKKTTNAEAERLRQIAQEQRLKIVDEFGRLDVELAPLKSKIRRLEDLGKIIRGWFAEEDPEATLSAEGKEFEVVVGPAGMQTQVADNARLYRVMGHENFLQSATITLKALGEKLDAGVAASLTWKTRTGSRTIVSRKRETARSAA